MHIGLMLINIKPKWVWEPIHLVNNTPEVLTFLRVSIKIVLM